MNGLAQMLVVFAAVAAATVVDYAVSRVQLVLDIRRNARTLRRLRAVAPIRCPACGCQVRDDHEPDGEDCGELQVERAARTEARLEEWWA